MYWRILILAIFIFGCSHKTKDNLNLYQEIELGEIIQPIDIVKSQNNSYIIMEGGSIAINLNIKKAGDYIIFAHYIANDSYSDSIFIKMDNQKFSIWDMKKSKKWKWSPIKSRKSHNKIMNFSLKKGKHKLIVKTREKRVRLDALYLSPKKTNTKSSSNVYFASTNGTKDECSKSNPCSLFIANQKLQAGDTLLLYKGVYNLKSNNLVISSSGTKNHPITIKPYKKDRVILDGGILKKKDASSNNVGITIYNKNYIIIQGLEIRNMSGEGISITGSHNIIDRCKIYNNFATGVAVTAYDSHKKRCSSCNKGFNIIKNSKIYNNSGAGIYNRQKDDGNNADGIAIASGQSNIVEHNIIYGNSDDGIDTWWSNDTIVRYNEVYNNGKGKKGNGNGIKAGGDKRAESDFGKRTVVEHNIVHDNRNVGIHYNLGKNVIIKHNIAYHNKVGFKTANNTIVEHNREYNNTHPTIVRAKHKFNSWQK